MLKFQYFFIKNKNEKMFAKLLTNEKKTYKM